MSSQHLELRGSWPPERWAYADYLAHAVRWLEDFLTDAAVLGGRGE